MAGAVATRPDLDPPRETTMVTEPRCHRTVPVAATHAAPGDGAHERCSGPVPDSPERYATLIHEVAVRHELSPDLVRAVIQVESEFNARAVSPSGARGLMQLMPETASRLGVRDAFDPRENVEGGVRHLRYLMTRYRGRSTLALAAYNAGELAVNHYGGVPPFPETRAYVRRVLALHAGRSADGARASRRPGARAVSGDPGV
jgi:hypothetical protein